ncbi:MAG: hypothetical protein JSS81_30280 [Acidobacteria bacterium]|nr:hypothetical protein [Acidobacteriota bacterium]
MQQQQRLEQLRLLRLQVAAFSAVKCRMAHERVVRNSETGLPIALHFPEGCYRRIGLCAHEIRDTQLGCSHTIARVRLKEAIKVLDGISGGPSAPDSPFGGELVRLDNAIHLLDHRKGDAEKRLAESLEEAHRDGETGDSEEKMRAAENEIRELEELHNGYVEEIGRLRDKIITEIDRLLAELTISSLES